jgi:predicted DCC family thiol-disulfide oxidoreductase YuxK
VLAEHGRAPETRDSVILIEGKRAFSRSDAALRIAAHLDGAWPVLSAFRLIPRFIRDRIYDRLAANRYRWFGKTQECMLPTPEMHRRFLK